MATLTVIKKTNTSGQPTSNGKKIAINTEKLIGFSTNSLYIRTGHLNGTLFLSQKGNGTNGSGDICKANEDATIEVNESLFSRISILAEKANAIVQ